MLHNKNIEQGLVIVLRINITFVNESFGSANKLEKSLIMILELSLATTIM